MLDNDLASPASRDLHIQTLRGPVNGRMRIGPRARTLDDLNLDSRDFVTLHEPDMQAGHWSAGAAPLAICKSTILFATEVSDFQPSGDNRSGQYTRSLINVLIGDYVIRGFVHVPPRGDPLMRLNQQRRSFIAMTSASVVGPNAQFATAFLAVNRSHISAAQRIDESSAEPVAADMEAGARS